MSILKSILNKIFPSSHANTSSPSAAQAPATPTPNPSAAPSSAGPASAELNSQITETDVEKILNDLAAKSGQPSNWRVSIVDLLKLLDLDSSLQSRKALAEELHYSGDAGDSASMNIWLHKQVMNKLAANGGKVPADLKD
ncbi:MAG TPA: DUF3597 domain-containing protein [Cellvibrionaceae bacterium]